MFAYYRQFLAGLAICAPLVLPVTTVASTSKVQTQRIELPQSGTVDKPGTGIPLDAIDDAEGELPPLPDSPDPEEREDAKPSEEPAPEVLRDLSLLPPPVAATRQKILDAALAGNIEELRPLIGTGEDGTSLSFGGVEGDPVAFLRGTSGDEEGHEILAIMAEVLEAGFVRLDPDTEEELYVWPYFFAWPLDKLTPGMRVELFRILTAGDLEDSISFGGYIFYRLGIRPDGTWAFFLSGD